MFEETIRTLRKLDGTTSIPVSISYDEDGYFDRECPSEECEYQFRVHLEDWKAKVRGEEVFCPFCGHAADSTEWNTEEQIEHLKQAAIAHLRSTMGSALKRDADSWNRRQPWDTAPVRVGGLERHRGQNSGVASGRSSPVLPWGRPSVSNAGTSALSSPGPG